MVQITVEEIRSLFAYRNGELVGNESTLRRKESNSRVVGKSLGTLTKSGHLTVNFKLHGVRYRKLVHHVIWFMHYNYWPEMIDHINRIPNDNRIENLREADKRVNSINRGSPANNTSGFRGISKNKLTGKWEAYIGNKNRRKYLGLYSCIGAAIKARLLAEERFWSDVR